MVRGIDRAYFKEQVDVVLASVPELKDIIKPHQLKDGFLVLPGENREELLSLLPLDFTPSAEFDQLVEQNGYGYGSPDSSAVDALNGLIAKTRL